jgi:hypothetical protein
MMHVYIVISVLNIAQLRILPELKNEFSGEKNASAAYDAIICALQMRFNINKLL